MYTSTNIAKVESRSKVCFDYAETKAYICAKHKYSHNFYTGSYKIKSMPENFCSKALCTNH